MKILYLLAFGGGLATAVYAMLHGVERNRGAVLSRPSPHMNLPALAAFLVAFGAVGYLLLRNSTLSPLVTGVIAMAGGAIGWVGMTVLMAKWALLPSTPDAHSEAEEFQGQLAVVIRPILGETEGSIRYERDGSSKDAHARSINESVLPAGSDVVIDRFENGVAIVEDWASVERRL